MSTALGNSPFPSPFLNDDPYKRIGGLQKNCLLAPCPRSHCGTSFRISRTSSSSTSSRPNNFDTFNTNNHQTFDPASSTAYTTPSSYTGTDYFSLPLSHTSTPQYTLTPRSTPATSPLPLPQFKFTLRLPSTSTSASVHNIVLKPIYPQDLEPIATVFEKAFSTDELRLAIKPPHNIDPGNQLEERRWRILQYTLAMQMPESQTVMAVDESCGGKIVGAAGFFMPGGAQWREDTAPCEEKLPGHWVRNLRRMAAGVTERAREEVLRGNFDVWELSQLFVDPDYQRQGIGKMLLDWGLEQSDKAGCAMYLEGTPRGKPFYEQMGFAVEAKPVFPGVIGENGEDYCMYFMKREPRGNSEDAVKFGGSEDLKGVAGF